MPEVDRKLSRPISVLCLFAICCVAALVAGRLRVLAHWGDEPLSAMPELTSLSQAGICVELAQWTGLFLPAGAPAAVVERLRAAAKAAGNDSKVQATIESAGLPLKYLDTPEFVTYWRKDSERLAKAVDRVGKGE